MLTNDNRYLTLMAIPFSFTVLSILLVLYINSHMFKKCFLTNVQEYRHNYIKLQKSEAKIRVDNIIKYIENMKKSFPDIKENDIKKLTLRWIEDNQYQNKYIFLYELFNPKGGDKFAKMVLNPNRKDLEGKYLSSNYKDSKGVKFREIMLQNILKDGDTFITYFYKKPDSKQNIEKMSYFKYFKEYNWIIATGIYFDSVDAFVKEYKDKTLTKIKSGFFKLFIFIMILTSISIILLLLIVHKLKQAMSFKNETIEKHKEIFKEIVILQDKLISSNDIEATIKIALKEIVNIIDVDRVYVFQNHTEDNKLYCSQRFEYTNGDVEAQIDNPILQNVSYDELLARWKEAFLERKEICGLVKTFPEVEREVLESQDIVSILVEPIYFRNKFWGFIGFDECKSERVWDETDRFSLTSLANSFVSIMEKQDYLQQLQNDIKEITYLENKNRELIHTLENQVQSQVDELRKKDNILIQQSKMAAMGEMISNIAHQWRQPLNVLSTSIINISLKNELNTLNSADLEHCVNQSQKVIQDMSKTIDDFRDFFVPRKEKIEFNVMDIINDSIELIRHSLDVNAIKLDINCEEHCYIAGYKNDLKQVILVILNNAKDAIKSKELKDGLMFISSICNKNSLILKFRDNGGGVPDDIKDKIFEPYFTTKHKSQGTGIGLYMVMEIITKHFSGNIEVKNVEYEYNGKAQKGAEFVITIPLKSQ